MVWLSGARISPAVPGARSAVSSVSSRRATRLMQPLADHSGVYFFIGD